MAPLDAKKISLVAMIDPFHFFDIREYDAIKNVFIY